MPGSTRSNANGGPVPGPGYRPGGHQNHPSQLTGSNPASRSALPGCGVIAWPRSASNVRIRRRRGPVPLAHRVPVCSIAVNLLSLRSLLSSHRRSDRRVPPENSGATTTVASCAAGGAHERFTHRAAQHSMPRRPSRGAAATARSGGSLAVIEFLSRWGPRRDERRSLRW